MPKFRVIKAHDGIEEGTIRSLPVSPITEYMTSHGFWELVDDEPKPAVKPTKRTTAKKTK